MAMAVSSSGDSARKQGLRALSRGLICGYVDAYTLLTFGVFTSFMSGNTTSTGLNAGLAKLASAGHNLLPIPFFVLGILGGVLLQPAKKHRTLSRLSALVAAMLTASVVVGHFSGPQWLNVIIVSTAMGIMNTTITHVGGQPVNLGFVTGDLKNLGEHLANGIKRVPIAQAQGPLDTHWRRAALLASIWTSFLVGAVLGGAVASHLAVWTLLLPAIMLLGLAVAESADDAASADVHSAESPVGAADGSLQHATAMASLEQIRSPIDGIVTARNIEVGSLVSPTGPGQGMTLTPSTGTGVTERLAAAHDGSIATDAHASSGDEDRRSQTSTPPRDVRDRSNRI